LGNADKSYGEKRFLFAEERATLRGRKNQHAKREEGRRIF